MAVLTIDDCAASKAPPRLMRRIDKMMSAYIETRIAGLDLSYQQWIALKVVRDRLVATAGELARELGITTGATTRLIDVLETRGLLRRDRDGEDRRVVQLAVTPAARTIIEQLQGEVLGAWNDVVVDFPDEEMDVFMASLRKLFVAVEQVAGVAELRGVTA